MVPNLIHASWTKVVFHSTSLSISKRSRWLRALKSRCNRKLRTTKRSFLVQDQREGHPLVAELGFAFGNCFANPWSGLFPETLGRIELRTPRHFRSWFLWRISSDLFYRCSFVELIKFSFRHLDLRMHRSVIAAVTMLPFFYSISWLHFGYLIIFSSRASLWMGTMTCDETFVRRFITSHPGQMTTETWWFKLCIVVASLKILLRSPSVCMYTYHGVPDLVYL